jgi:hypothetical protein
MTSSDLLPWALATVRAIEDAGLGGDNPHVEALKIQREIAILIEEPPGPAASLAADWVRHDVPKLRALVAFSLRFDRGERARMFEAVIALRLLTADVCLSGRARA